MIRFMTAAAVAALLAGPALAQTAQPTTGQTGTAPADTTTTTTTTTPTLPEEDAEETATEETTTTTTTTTTNTNAGGTMGSTASGNANAGGATGMTASGNPNAGGTMGAAMANGNVQVTANAPIPDTPENRARYGQPESNAGKRTIGEGPAEQTRRSGRRR